MQHALKFLNCFALSSHRNNKGSHLRWRCIAIQDLCNGRFSLRRIKITSIKNVGQQRGPADEFVGMRHAPSIYAVRRL